MVLSGQSSVLYGPLQMFVIGFPGNQFKGEIIPALNDAREKGVIRMIDYFFVMKDNDDNITAIKGSDLGPKETEQFRSVIGALLGLGAAGIEGAEVGAEVGAQYSERDVGLTERDVKNVAKDIPRNSSALFMLVEHLWAKKIKESLVNAGGVMLAQGMLTPELVVKVGAALTR